MEKALITTNDMTALVLCGGAGQRFGGADKPLAIFNGDLGARPMVDYVIHRLPENTRVLISANRNFEHYALRGRVVPDKETGRSQRGPLVGIYAGIAGLPYSLASGLSRGYALTARELAPTLNRRRVRRSGFKSAARRTAPAASAVLDTNHVTQGAGRLHSRRR